MRQRADVRQRVYMLDERLLTDPLTCPSCAARLPSKPDRCATCGLPLQGPYAAQLWQASAAAARLLAERRALIAALRATPLKPPPAPVAPADPTSARAEWTTRRVQNLLLTLGVLLLSTAAVIFTAVAWGDLGVGGRGAVLAGMTAFAAAAAVVSRRRALTATAEAVGALAVGLLLLDAYALWRLDVLAVRDPHYWAAALGVVAALTALAARFVPLAGWRLSAAVAAQLPVPVLAVTWTASQAALALVVQGAGVAAIASRAGSVRLVLLTGGPLTWGVGSALAAGTAYAAADAGAVRPALVLGVAALTAAAVALVRPERRAERQVAAAVATAAGILAVHAGTYDLLPGRWPATSAAGLGLVAVLAAGRLPARWRPGPTVVAAGATVLGLLAVADRAALAVTGPLSWLGAIWTTDGHGSAVTLLFPDAALPGGWPAAAAALVLGAAAAVVAHRWTRPVGLGLATLGVATLPLAADVPYAVAVLGDVVLGAVAVVAASLWRRPALAAAGVVLGGLGLAWSAAAEATTLAAVGLAALGAVATALLTKPPARSIALGAGLALAAVEAAALVAATGGRPSQAGFAALATAAVGMAAGSLLLNGRDRLAVEVTGAGAAGLAVLAITEAGWLAAGLLLAGAAVGLMATRPDRRPLGWVSGALLVLGSWAEFAHLGVSVAEVYTTIPATALLAHGWLRRRRDPTLASWPAYGPGLALGLLPSLAVAVGDPGLARPLLLGLTALVVTAYGAHRRLQAPLVVGGLTLAADALAQVAPYAAALPRWATIGAAGLTLVLMGATYERRLRDLHQLRGHLGRMG